jgi:hypothetical protein
LFFIIAGFHIPAIKAEITGFAIIQNYRKEVLRPGGKRSRGKQDEE